MANLRGDATIAEPARTIQALDRGLRLLTLIAESPHPLSRSEAARLAGLNPSTSFRLLATLEAHGLIERAVGGGYRRGVATLLLAAGGIEESIRRHARPLLEVLRDATGESAVVSAVGAASFAPIEQVDGVHSLSVRWTGRSYPLHCSSPGKLVLAALGEDQLAAFLARPLEACTPLTLTDPACHPRRARRRARDRHRDVDRRSRARRQRHLGRRPRRCRAPRRDRVGDRPRRPSHGAAARRHRPARPQRGRSARPRTRHDRQEMTVAEERDVVIVGGGIAGLVSAHRLRDRDPVVLEASDRVGGRIWSQQRGDLALSVGAHMFPPPDSVVGKIVTELGLEVMPITGSMLNIHLGGRMVRDVRPELLPFRLPLSAAGRVSFARAGLKVKRDADAYMKLLTRGPGETDADVRLRALKHRGDETFLDFLGKLHPDAFRIFEALSNRSLADPDEISQSAMSALFGHVWDTGDLGRNMRGGSGLLPDALGASLGPIVRLGTTRDLHEPRRRGRAHRLHRP